MIEQLYALYLQHPVVSTDTRQLPQGCIFFALKGESFDGNRFAAQALENGAAYAVIDDPQFRADERFVLVPDVLKALQQLATYHRLRFDIPIIAIGGSNGKTTTKELISSVLTSHYPCHFTKGNLNNHIGVPLTLLSMPGDTEVAVIEMGTNQPGDIEQLCAIARPTHGLLTNIGKEHLEGFGSLEGVKKAEGELYDYLAGHSGTVFLNLSEQYLPEMAERNRRRVEYRESAVLNPNDGTIEIQLLQDMPFVKAAFLSDDGVLTEVQTHLFGRHNFNNIMTAIALGIYFKVPAATIQSALESYRPSNNRSQIVSYGTNTVLLDAYNANPSSMEPALKSLQAMPAARKIAILGDMLELGEQSHEEHTAILQLAAGMHFDHLIVVGKEFGQTPYEKLGALHFPDNTAAKTWLQAQHFDNALILIKASRGIRLEKVLEG